MELWVRSQDEERLVLTKGFEIQSPSYNGGCQIFAVWQNNYQCVGNYKTKERALEVLDEIQNLLMPIMKSTPIIEEDIKPKYTYRHYVSKGSDIEVIQLNTYVYEMPIE